MAKFADTPTRTATVDGTEYEILDIDYRQNYDTIYTSTPTYDPNWSAVDANGHRHRMVDRDFPTLRLVVDGTYDCDCCAEQREVTHYECVECGEVVEPGTHIPPPQTIATTRETIVRVAGRVDSPECSGNLDGVDGTFIRLSNDGFGVTTLDFVPA